MACHLFQNYVFRTLRSSLQRHVLSYKLYACVINSTTWLHNVQCARSFSRLQGSKRPVVLPNVENAEQIILLNLAKEVFSDVIYCHEGSSSDCTTAQARNQDLSKGVQL